MIYTRHIRFTFIALSLYVSRIYNNLCFWSVQHINWPLLVIQCNISLPQSSSCRHTTKARLICELWHCASKKCMTWWCSCSDTVLMRSIAMCLVQARSAWLGGVPVLTQYWCVRLQCALCNWTRRSENTVLSISVWFPVQSTGWNIAWY